MSLGAINPADGLAMSMVVILVLSFGVVALLVIGIKRSGKRAETEAEKLLEELRRDEEDEERHPAPPSGAGETREPWEREEDWWKK